MSLYRKALMIVMGLSLLAVLGVYLSARWVVLPRFMELERLAIVEDLHRVDNMLAAETAAMSMMVHDWGEWDDTYAFMEGALSTYVESNLGSSSFHTLGVDHIVYIDVNGELYRSFSYSREEGLWKRLPGGLADSLKLLAVEGDWSEPPAGFLRDGKRVWMLAAARILPTDQTGPARGTLFMVRPFDGGYRASLADQMRVDLDFQALGDDQGASALDMAAAAARLQPGDSLVKPHDKQWIAGYTMMADLFGDPVLVARLIKSRDVFRQGVAATYYSLAWGIAGALGLAVLVGWLLHRTVLKRLSDLRDDALTIGKDGAAGSRVSVVGNDEISELGASINHMLEGLEDAWQQRRETEQRQSRQSDVLLGVAKDLPARSADFTAATQLICRAGLDGTKADRASLWLLDEQRKVLQCFDVCCRPLFRHESGPLLQHDEHTELFSGMQRLHFDESLQALMARRLSKQLHDTDPVYPGPQIVMPLSYDSVVRGVLLLEHRSADVSWHPDQSMFAMSLAEFVTQALAMEQRQRLEAELRRLASYDSLTGLPNRVLFYERLSTAIGRARESQLQVALLYVDLDNFKPVNDELGHDVGDVLLQEVSERLRNTVRQEDTVARLGGDEFTVILLNQDAVMAAKAVASKVIPALSERIDIEGHQIGISASIGVAIFPDHASTHLELINKADSAMYCAKAQGGGCFAFFDPDQRRESMPG